LSGTIKIALFQTTSTSGAKFCREFLQPVHLTPFQMFTSKITGAPMRINEVDRRPALKVDFWMLRSPPFEMAMFERRLGVNFVTDI